MTTIMGIKLDNRTHTAIEFQQILTNYGCIIKTRIGLHDVADNKCAPNGVILLEIINDEEVKQLESDLRAIDGINIQMMKF